MINNMYSSTYEVTPLTMAIVAAPENHTKPSAMVLEEEGTWIVENTPSKIMENACKFFGSSLKGRQEGTRSICGITHKAPISIAPSCGMYFFPTASPSSHKCSWIAHSHIEQVNRGPYRQTEIIFKNGKTILLDVSFGSILNQVQRTAQYRYMLDNRIKYAQRDHVDVVAEPYP
ncbi:competence transcription factor ComK [Lentibacillus halophilus]|uniref:Competence transcription factor ComK n=1 Tax=Lentibacillus halophilus TaxID=295065 RepID=A0ABN0Z8M1_9BACI